jgi:hypothetical protein
MIAIKPGIFNHYLKKFTKEMIKDYFHKIRVEYSENAEAPPQILIDKIIPVSNKMLDLSLVEPES